MLESGNLKSGFNKLNDDGNAKPQIALAPSQSQVEMGISNLSSDLATLKASVFLLEEKLNTVLIQEKVEDENVEDENLEKYLDTSDNHPRIINVLADIHFKLNSLNKKVLCMNERCVL